MGRHFHGVEFEMRRVVVTGLGMVTPLGCGVEPTWTRILAGKSGARKIDTFDTSDLTCRIACMIPRGDGSDGTFNPDQWMEPKDQRKVDDFIVFAMAAARQALDDANWHPSTEEERCATGTMIGSGIGGLSGIADTAVLLKERGPRKVSPFFIPGRLINLRACDRRRQPPDRARRCRCHGGGRHRIANLPDRHGWLLRGSRAFDR